MKVILREKLDEFCAKTPNGMDNLVYARLKEFCDFLDGQQIVTLHRTQEKLMELEDNQLNLTLREIGEFIGVKYPQAIKHHLNQLIKWGYIDIIGGQRIKHTKESN